MFINEFLKKIINQDSTIDENKKFHNQKQSALKAHKDLMDIYLKEINLFPLLSAEEELKLGEHIQKGNLKAKNRLVQSNLRLVVSIAKRYSNSNLQLIDLIQEGNIGLIVAAERFNPDKKIKFSTYATWWIKQRISRALSDQSRTIRLPDYISTEINKMKKTIYSLTQNLGRKPNNSEISKNANIPIDKVKLYKRISEKPLSLDIPVNEEESEHLINFIVDQNKSDLEEKTQKQILKNELMKHLNILKEQEKLVIQLRFGMSDGYCHSQKEIAKFYNVSSERIRQIEHKSLKKLKESLIKSNILNTSSFISSH